jgi:hypothetical protein
LSISLFLLWWMEFEDHYVTCSLKHTMEHWLWCAVLLIEVSHLEKASMIGSLHITWHWKHLPRHRRLGVNEVTKSMLSSQWNLSGHNWSIIVTTPKREAATSCSETFIVLTWYPPPSRLPTHRVCICNRALWLQTVLTSATENQKLMTLSIVPECVLRLG